MENKEAWSFNKKDIFTIPNILTYFRFLLIIPFSNYFLIENYNLAAISILTSALTDCFDGIIARKFNQVTSLGKILDPIADKFTLFAVVICMVIYIPQALPALIILLFKEVLMLLGGVDLVKKGITPPAAMWFGKIGTITFYISICLIVFLKAAYNYENYALNFTLFSLTAFTMLFALFQYGRIYFHLIKEHSEREKK